MRASPARTTDAMRERIAGEPLNFHTQRVRREWARLLGPIGIDPDQLSVHMVSWGASPDLTEGRVLLEPEEGIRLPTLLRRTRVRLDSLVDGLNRTVSRVLMLRSLLRRTATARRG